MSKVKRVGTTGDRNPLDHDGGIVWECENGEYLWEWCYQFNRDDGKGIRYMVYKYWIPKDVMKELNWADWKAIGKSCGNVMWQRMTVMSKDSRVMRRVQLLEMLIGYYNPQELDSYPEELSREELKKRWKD